MTTRFQLFTLSLATFAIALTAAPQTLHADPFCEEEGQTVQDVYDLCMASGSGTHEECYYNASIYYCNCYALDCS
jgi:hypothetical protein